MQSLNLPAYEVKLSNRNGQPAIYDFCATATCDSRPRSGCGSTLRITWWSIRATRPHCWPTR